MSSDEVVKAKSEDHEKIRSEKLNDLAVKFLRLVHRFGQTPHNSIVAQSGYTESLRSDSTGPVLVSYDRDNVLAEQLELSGSDQLDFSCTILLLGKAGVGKSSTINSLFNDPKRVPIHTFGPGTRWIRLICQNINGIIVKFIDTPVLYFDRLDDPSWDYGDVALLQMITKVFGASFWFNVVIVLTHAACASPEGANGKALSYDMFVTRRMHVVQQNIRQAAGDAKLMNPASLVENHMDCRMNETGKRVLPNGIVWQPQLLLLSFGSKILREANVLLKLEDSNACNSGRGGKIVPYFLANLLRSRSLVKLPEEQFEDFEDYIDENDLEEDLDEDLEDKYDDLPPLKRLTREQFDRLSKEYRTAYLDELQYRYKLLIKKLLKEERRRRKIAKKMKQKEYDNNNKKKNNKKKNKNNNNNNHTDMVVEDETVRDVLTSSNFDSDTPIHRYRYLDTYDLWPVEPVFKSHGWDHDLGVEGLTLKKLFVIKNKVPVSVFGQLTKDKKESSLKLDVSSSVRHGEINTSSFGLDLETLEKDMSYTLQGETHFRNFKRNTTSARVSVNFLGDSISGGIKVEDKLLVNKQVMVLATGGAAMTRRGDTAWGGLIETTFKDRDYPIGRLLSSLALSVMGWHDGITIGLDCLSQVPVPVGRETNLVFNGKLNSKGYGKVGFRLNSSNQFPFALIALLPLVGHFKRLLFGSRFD